jgi:HlyD family secretion protein
MSANADIETQTVRKRRRRADPVASRSARREGNKTIEQQAAERDKKAKELKGEGAASAVNERQQRERDAPIGKSLQRVVFRPHRREP